MRTLFFALSLFVAAPALAEAPPADAAEAWQALGKATSMSASFTQVQQRAILPVPLESTGTLTFERPDKLRWVVNKPTKQILILNGSTLTMETPVLGPPQVLDVSKPEIAGLIRGLTVWLAGDFAALQRDYTLTYWAPGPPAKAELVPNDPRVKGFIDKLKLTLSEDRSVITEVVIVEPSGDTIRMTLSDVALNQPVPDDAFTQTTP